MIAGAILLAGMLGIAAAASAQSSYPDRPIRWVVGFPPGGPNDLLARLIAPRLAEHLKQPIVIENRAGSNGEIATAMIARAAPDGYTWLMASNGSITIAAGLGRKLPYDPRADLAPVALIASNPMLLVVRPGLAASNVAELIALAKAQPGKLNGASAGAGGPTHLALELLKSMAGIDIVHVPYKGGGPAMTDLMANQVDLYFGGLVTALPQVKAGRLRALAVTTPTRSGAAPEIATIAQSGLAGYDANIWYGLFVPPATPRAIVTTIHAAMLATLKQTELRARLLEQGADPHEITPDQFAERIQHEIARWAQVARTAGIKPE